MTPFSTLCAVCGLSHREAADFVRVRLDTVKNWSSGRDVTPKGVIAALIQLNQRIQRAADQAVSVVMEQRPPIVELGYPADDEEALSLGWPSVGVMRVLLGRIISGIPDGIPVRLVPRGSTPATAAAADAQRR
jgi:hypothetical protein